MRVDHNSASASRRIHKSVARPPDASCNDVASYIAEMSDELRRLAQSKDLTFLSSLLSLATIEAKRMLEVIAR